MDEIKMSGREQAWETRMKFETWKHKMQGFAM